MRRRNCNCQAYPWPHSVGRKCRLLAAAADVVEVCDNCGHPAGAVHEDAEDYYGVGDLFPDRRGHTVRVSSCCGFDLIPEEEVRGGRA